MEEQLEDPTGDSTLRAEKEFLLPLVASLLENMFFVLFLKEVVCCYNKERDVAARRSERSAASSVCVTVKQRRREKLLNQTEFKC